MRGLIVFFWLCALAFKAPGATPELGKDALRKLVKLPTVAFDATWSFDPERGFSVGSRDQDVLAEIADLRKQMKHVPADAENYLRIGELYNSINDAANARKTWTRAADLFRKRVDSDPGNGLLLAEFGRALDGAGKPEEAESKLRDAVRLAPSQWKCRVALARFLDAQARRELSLGQTTSDKITLARHELAESDECFGKAASLAPDEGEIFFRRGLHRCLETSLLNDIRVAEGETLDEVLLKYSVFSDAALADLQHASRLLPEDHALIGSVVLFEIYASSARQDRLNWADFSWSTVPEKSQRSIRDAVVRLEALGQDPDPRQAMRRA